MNRDGFASMYLRAITTCFFLLATGLQAGASCIGIVPASSEHLFWHEVIRGAETAAREHGLETYVRPPNTERNAAAQIFILEKVLEEGCEGILLAPNSDNVLSKVPALAETGTAVVYIDRDMGGAPAGVVKTDNFEAGFLAGRELVKRLKGSGRVALLRMHPGVPSTTDREAGFLSAIEGTGLQVVHEQYIGSTVEKAREQTAKIIQSGVEFDAIFTPNESTTLGALLTLKHLGLAGNFQHIGFDFTPLLLSALREGEISGLVIQQPYRMGYAGAQTLIKVMSHQDYDPMVTFPAFYVDRRNIDDPDIQEIVDVDYE